MDWKDWHLLYETSPSLQERLRLVGDQIAAALDECPPGPIRIVSLCAGDGRDVIGALSRHPRHDEIFAFLLETHAESIARGRAAARSAGLERQICFQDADATIAGNYADAVPVDLVVLSGVLGHVRRGDTRRFFELLPSLGRRGVNVVWSRHLFMSRDAASVTEIRDWFRLAGYDERYCEFTAVDGFAVGRVQFNREPEPIDPSQQLFEFVGMDRLSGSILPRSWEMTRVDAEAVMEDPFALQADCTLVRFFEERSWEFEKRTAVGAGDWQPNYGELNGTANRVAHALLSRGGRKGDRVAILMRHDGPLVAAALSVLKADRIAVVLNPTDPAVRLRQVLEDAEPAVILVDEEHREFALRIAKKTERIVCFDEHALGDPAPDPGGAALADDVAFLIYTSGSTGRPKGVMQTHRNILHNALRLTHGLELNAEDRMAFLASAGGGLGLSTLWCGLLSGAALCPFAAMQRGVTGLAGWMRDRRITILITSASLFRGFMRTLGPDDRFPDVRRLRLASESATPEDLALARNRFCADAVVVHTLSSSETGNVTRWRHRCGNGIDLEMPRGSLPLGWAVEGVEVMLLDDAGGAVAPGETGEIAIRSRYLSPGYWRDESLTGQRFSGPDGLSGLRTYRSGDLGRRTRDGLLMFMGRKDARIKIHGHRVELSEIEGALAEHPAVERAIVCARPQSDGPASLAAYVIFRDGRSCSTDGLRRHLRAALPEHMVPSAFVFLECFPLTAHGKIDVEALRRIRPSAAPSVPGEEPATDTEHLLARIWSDLFEKSAIFRGDDFFDLGGDSLLATAVAARVHESWKVQLDLGVFADHPTLAALAAEIDRRHDGDPVESSEPMVRAPREAPLVLSFVQERTWKYSRMPQGAAGYIVGRRHEISGALDVELLRKCMSFVERRHEILRTSFVEQNGRPMQMVHPPAPVEVPLLDFSSAPDAEEQAMSFFAEQRQRPMDLARPPLNRFWLVRIREGCHWLLRIGHHIISDGVSWELYFREVGLVYEAGLCGEQPPLPEWEPLQYADFAAWERSALRPDGPAYREELAWWKEQFGGCPDPSDFPFGRSAPVADVKPGEGLIRWGIEPSACDRLARIANREGATYFVVRLAAFVAALAEASGRREVILGTYVTNRRKVETQRMLGFFANLVTLRFDCDPDLTFCDWLLTVRSKVNEVHGRSAIPYEQLSEDMRAAGVSPPEIRILFSVDDLSAPIEFGGLKLRVLERQPKSMPWGFTMMLNPHYEQQRCGVSFDARIYDPERVRRFVDRYARLLDAVSRKPESRLADLLVAETPSVV